MRFVHRQSTHADMPTTQTMPWALSAVIVAVCVLSILVVASASVGGEGFDAAPDRTRQVLDGQAYAMLDERCPLNDHTYTTACSGVVRHPTESSAGVCVFRGGVAGGGECGPGNETLYDERYVSRLGVEDVEGRPECVLRMHPLLSDAEADSYETILVDVSAKTSRPYLSLAAQLKKVLDDIAATQEETRETEQQNAAIVDTLRVASSRCDDDGKRLQYAVNRLRGTVAQDGVDLSNALAALDRDCQYRMTMRDNERQQALNDQATLCSCAKNLPPCPPLPHDQYMVVLGDLSDGDLYSAWVDKDDMDQCRDKCASESRCTHFSFDHGNGQCFIKAGMAMPNHGWPGNGWMTSAISLDRYPRDTATKDVYNYVAPQPPPPPPAPPDDNNDSYIVNW